LIDSVQKTAILGTSHIIRKVLQCEAWSVSGGDPCWFKRSTGKKRNVTRDDNSNNNNNNTITFIWTVRNLMFLIKKITCGMYLKSLPCEECNSDEKFWNHINTVCDFQYGVAPLRFNHFKTAHFIIFTFVPCILILSKFYLFTNWCTSELS